MKKSTLFIQLALLPFITSLIFIINSFIDFYPYWNSTSWDFFYFDYYLYLPYLIERGAYIAYLILIGLFVSVSILIRQTHKVFKYSGFPSMKEAKSYYDLANKIKEKQRLERVNKEYQIKLAKLEEEKKKYL